MVEKYIMINWQANHTIGATLVLFFLCFFFGHYLAFDPAFDYNK